MAQKSAKFFCENCGAEVPKDARMCRHCGRFFSSVRCPQCGTTGSTNKFSNGCPTCGYALGPTKGKSSTSLKNISEKKAGYFSKRALKNEINKRYNSINGIETKGDESLPFWMYIFIFIALFFVLFLFLKFFH